MRPTSPSISTVPSAHSVSTVPNHISNRSLSPSTIPAIHHIHYGHSHSHPRPRPDSVHDPQLSDGDKKRERYWSGFKYSRPNYGKIRSNAIKNISNPVKSVKKKGAKNGKTDCEENAVDAINATASIDEVNVETFDA